jgi:hypothetical protein
MSRLPAATFCYTLLSSAKPVAIFASLADTAAHGPRDLLRLSAAAGPRQRRARHGVQPVRLAAAGPALRSVRRADVSTREQVGKRDPRPVQEQHDEGCDHMGGRPQSVAKVGGHRTVELISGWCR